MNSMNIILEIEKDILKILYEIKKLEEEGLISSEKYQSLIELLNNKLLLEESLLSKLTTEDYTNILNVIKNSNVNEINQQLNAVVMCDYERLVKIRLLNKIVNYLKNNISNNNIFTLSLIKTNEIMSSLNMDFINTLLCILNTYITNHYFDAYKNDLYKVKYNLAFLYDYVLEDFKDKKFAIGSEIYWQSDAVIASLKIKVEVNHDSYINSVFMNSFDNILNSNSSIDSKALIYSIILRAANLFSTEEMFAKYAEETNNNYQAYKDRLQGYELQRARLLCNTFTFREQDKELLRIISISR